MPPAIRIENLGKRYRVNHALQHVPYRTLREALVSAATAPLRRLRAGGHDGAVEDFWALKDITFDVQPGEVVGIIGRNGAGKSTLLKILSRITKPTTGRVTLRGRVGSLLEVGTGFHPELTGRENVYLNGGILGMSRKEIDRNFDAIVDFSGVEKFLDTPVKRYSSGMQVRLAFAVAAHLDPEILIVDEVLAVGDIAFQRKCLGRMREVSQTGRTVLFVSHNMAAIESLCERAILLEAGRMEMTADVGDVVRAYCRRALGDHSLREVSLVDFGGPNRTQRAFRSVMLLDDAGEPIDFLPLGGDLCLRIGLEVEQPLDFPTIGIGFDDTMGQRVLTVHTPMSCSAIARLEGECQVECRIPRFPLAPGDYWVKLALSAHRVGIDDVEKAFCLRVAEGDAFGEGRGFHRGVCVSPSQWSLVDAVAGDDKALLRTASSQSSVLYRAK